MNHTGSNALDNNSNPAAEVGPYDVLCGRSAVALNNTGNRRFRITVSMALSRYLSTPTRTGKTKVIDSIVASVKSSGGRFLKWRNSQWIELDTKQAREKVGHALRDMSSSCEPNPMGPPTTALHNLPTRSAAQPSFSHDFGGNTRKRSRAAHQSESRQAKTHEERIKVAVASSLSLSSCSSSSSSSSSTTTSRSSPEPLDFGMLPLEGEKVGGRHDRFGDDHEYEFEFDLEPLSSLENSASAIGGDDILCLLTLLEKSEL